LNDIAEKVTTVREHNDGIDPDQNTRAPGARARAYTHTHTQDSNNMDETRINLSVFTGAIK